MPSRLLVGLVAFTSLTLDSPASGGQAPPAAREARVSLGIAVEELPNEGPHGGLIIRHLTEGGPAAKAGLAKGDVIIRASNRAVDDFDDLVGVIAGHKPGEQLSFVALREGEPRRFNVVLGEAAAKSGPNPEGCKSCAFLGAISIPVGELSPETAERFGLAEERGVVVVDVIPGSPAALAGLRHGDLIRSIDGTNLRDPDGLRRHVHEAGTGKAVKLAVVRGETKRELVATLAEGPCDVTLAARKPNIGGEAAEAIDRLERRVQALEKRLAEVERGRRDAVPADRRPNK